MAIHDGHRQRLKERFLREELDGFTEIQILELLLFYAIPVRDTNPLAHALLNRFGSLARVLEAPVEKLIQVEGIKEHSATLLKLAWAMTRAYEVSRIKNDFRIKSIAECGEYLLPFFRGRKNETVFLLCLDAKLKILDCTEIGEGSVNYANVPVRRVVETALEIGASSVILAHNHPSGIAIPSEDDYQTTKRLAAALSAVEINLADHIVVADDDYVSMLASGFRFDDFLVI